MVATQKNHPTSQDPYGHRRITLNLTALSEKAAGERITVLTVFEAAFSESAELS